MNILILVVSIVLLMQIIFFFIIRAKRKKDKEDNVIEKYQIRTPQDLFRLLQNPDLPDEDIKKLNELYQKDIGES